MTQFTKPLDSPATGQHDVIYALRTAHQSQTQLNLMADQKANILVGTIAIFLTFLFTRAGTTDLSDHRLIYVFALTAALELVALLLGIMVIRPRTRWMNHGLTIDQMPNPLFFGFFSSFSEEEYVRFMQQRMDDDSSARELLLRDLYQVGTVLKRKFALLKYAYGFAAAGLVMGALAFAWLMLPRLLAA